MLRSNDAMARVLTDIAQRRIAQVESDHRSKCLARIRSPLKVLCLARPDAEASSCRWNEPAQRTDGRTRTDVLRPSVVGDKDQKKQKKKRSTGAEWRNMAAAIHDWATHDVSGTDTSREASSNETK